MSNRTNGENDGDELWLKGCKQRARPAKQGEACLDGADNCANVLGEADHNRIPETVLGYRILPGRSTETVITACLRRCATVEVGALCQDTA